MARKPATRELERKIDRLRQIFDKSWRQLLTNLKQFIKPTLIVFVILCVGFLSIMRANFSYIDDMSRARYGVTGWENFSRHLTNFLASILHADNVLTDISPLPQLLALALMATAGVMLLHILTEKKKFSWIELVVAAGLTINPYFLECLSYKFDAPYMAISVLFALIPFLFTKKPLRQFLVVSFLCILGVCTTYQVSLAIYPMVVVVLAVKRWANREDLRKVFQFIGVSAFSFVIGVLFFQTFLMTRVDSYVSGALPVFNQIIPNTVNNFKAYYSDLLRDFRFHWLVLVAVIAFGFICTLIQSSKRKKFFTAGLGILVCPLLCLLCFGVYPLFEAPLFAPRAMYGFTTMITIMGIFAVNCKWKIPHAVFSLATIVLSWTFLNVSLTYGNTLAYYQEYVDFRTNLVAGELNTLPEVINATEEHPITLHFAGPYYIAPANKTAIQQYPILKRLIPKFGRGDWMWGYYKLENYYNLPNAQFQTLTNFDAATCQVLRTTAYFDICGDEQNITITLK